MHDLGTVVSCSCVVASTAPAMTAEEAMQAVGVTEAAVIAVSTRANTETSRHK